ncbi:MAG TPA: LPS export ABC transporter periplasmic protein LptC [Gemmatimonadaceae bacterium]
MKPLILGVIAILLAGACTTKKQPPVVGHSALADSADQVMYNARFNLTDQGLQRAHLESDTAYFFDDNTRIELEKVHTTFYTATGEKNAVLTSERGTFNSRTNNMIARKNVVVVTEDGRRLTTPELMYNQQRNEIASDSAFVETEPTRRIEGIGFRSDPDMKNIRILKGTTGIARGITTAPDPTAPTTAPAASSTPSAPPRSKK